MFRLESGITFSGDSLGNWLIINDALHGASTNILMSAHTSNCYLSEKAVVTKLEAVGFSRIALNPPIELWRVKIIATSKEQKGDKSRGVVFYWLRPVLAGGSPFLSMDGVSPCPADAIFGQIFTPIEVPV